VLVAVTIAPVMGAPSGARTISRDCGGLIVGARNRVLGDHDAQFSLVQAGFLERDFLGTVSNRYGDGNGLLAISLIAAIFSEMLAAGGHWL